MSKRKQLEKWSIAELVDRVESLNDSVNVVQCFGSRDVLELAAVTVELEARGYTVDFEKRVRIAKGKS